MRNPALQERRNRQILADLVRAYIETGEPVSSRAISKRYEETLSTATIRNVMADLEDGGLLYQPHTSAGRVPTAAAYRFFAQEIASQATLTIGDRDWIQREMGGAKTASEITERAGHVLAEVSNGLGIIVSPPLGRTVLEHARMWLLPDGRVVVVLISPGGNTRDKIVRPNRPFAQAELDATADFLNRHYSGWTLEAIRGDLLQKLATDREQYEGIIGNALTLWDPAMLGESLTSEVHVEGTAQIVGTPEFTNQAQLRELLAAIEEKHRLVTVLNACIETPEPVHVQIGVKEISEAGDNLAIISAPYTRNDLVQGSLGVLGPTRMHYERAMTAVAYVAQRFSEALSKICRTSSRREAAKCQTRTHLSIQKPLRQMPRRIRPKTPSSPPMQRPPMPKSRNSPATSTNSAKR
jgi:heat-inducible transcriptional repressor